MEKSITKQQVQQHLQSGGKMTIIDVRSKEEYDEKHIPEAINIPLDELPKHIDQLTEQELFITACGKGGGRSEKGAEKLKQLGINAVFLEGGTLGWWE
jgi:rhodanese-related sulfurtransferase